MNFLQRSAAQVFDEPLEQEFQARVGRCLQGMNLREMSGNDGSDVSFTSITTGRNRTGKGLFERPKQLTSTHTIF